MPKTPRRPLFQDYQQPRLFRAGMTLRRSFLTGPAATPEEEEMKALIDKADTQR
ncbi:hypothetical protein [Sphingomonas bacterium]|uniref:hypothetical protein n=1 Tax=Sphingomonas bacterium TaxID=1895847 RepID=UPI001575FDC8|nr:hypothetical protein [Sphingomonas bacterium]